MKTAKKSKDRTRVDAIRRKAFEEARWTVAKLVFPNFMAIVLLSVMDEFQYSKMKNFNLTEGEKQRLLKAIVKRTERYCEQGRNGVVKPYEVRQIFEKTTGIKLDDMYM